MWRIILISLVFALGLTLSDLIAFEYICEYGELGPTFYGFPFVYRTNTTWVNSMSGEIYLTGLLLNTLFWFIITIGLVFLFKKIKNIVAKKILKIGGWAFFGFIVFLGLLSILAIDWRLEISHDDFKMNYYTTDIECKRNLKWMI